MSAPDLTGREHPNHPGYTYGNVRRVLAKIDSSGPCWEWTGCVNAAGYGRVTINGHSQYSHRAVYLMLVGCIPEGLQLDHLCRNRKCVNPDHLEPVTQAENTRRGAGTTPAAAFHARECRYGRRKPRAA